MECKIVAEQKVVCVDPTLAPHHPLQLAAVALRVIEKGRIYTVASVSPCGQCDCILIELKGIATGWNHIAFRPLQDRPKEADTDISVFAPLLNAKTLEPAR